MSTDALLDMPEPAAPPRRNGELAFDEPWQSLVFGVTLGLCDRGDIRFEDFQRRLVEEIATWEHGSREAEWSYWTHWLAALEGELAARGLLGRHEIEAKMAEILGNYAHDDSSRTHRH